MQFRTPNPKIDFTNVTVPTTMTPWPKTLNSIRRAAINTFGAGGTNGHAVLESYPSPSDTIKLVERSEKPLLFKVSAADEQSLKALSEDYANYIERTKPDIHDLAHTLLSRRSILRKSFFLTAKSLDEVIVKLRSPSNIQTKGSEGSTKVLFVFTGQGAQWYVNRCVSYVSHFLCSGLAQVPRKSQKQSSESRRNVLSPDLAIDCKNCKDSFPQPVLDRVIGEFPRKTRKSRQS